MRQEQRVRDGIYLTCHMPVDMQGISDFAKPSGNVTHRHKMPTPTYSLIIQPCHITLNRIVLAIVREYSIHAVASQEET